MPERSYMGEYQTSKRMGAKLKAVGLPLDLTGKTVLDLGCDHGWWSKLASDRGAVRVLGIDHGRIVINEGWVDLAERCRSRGWPRCEFRHADLGNEWPDLGQWDVVLCLALYHHLYDQMGDHEVIWRWLWQCVADDGLLLWDAPWNTKDSVVARRAATGGSKYAQYTQEAILGAARRYFEVEVIGPALYGPDRYVLHCRPLPKGAE